MKKIVSFTRAVLFTLIVAAWAFPAVAGEFSRQDYGFSGSWTIVEQEGKSYVVFSEDFKTRSGPDLKIFLSPLSIDEIKGSNATKQSVLVARLRSSKGAQRYEIPAGTDLSKYKSLVVHCEKFSKLWGGDDLKALAASVEVKK